MHGVVEWLKSGDWRPTFEGVATFLTAIVALVAAVVAYRAVKKQIEADRENLRKELDAHKEAQHEELRRRKSAISKAILYEIDDFYKYYIGGQPKYFETCDPDYAPLIPMKLIGPKEFVVYGGIAGGLGDLDGDTVAAVISFYDAADWYQTSMRLYVESVEGRMTRPSANGLMHEEAARQLLGRLKERFPMLLEQSRKACRLLCRDSGIAFNELALAQDKERPLDSRASESVPLTP